MEKVEIKDEGPTAEVLPLENIIIDENITKRDQALELINKKLVEGGYTTSRYLDGLYAKEEEFNTIWVMA